MVDLWFRLVFLDVGKRTNQYSVRDLSGIVSSMVYSKLRGDFHSRDVLVRIVKHVDPNATHAGTQSLMNTAFAAINFDLPMEVLKRLATNIVQGRHY